MAALSVHIALEGRQPLTPVESQTSTNLSRKRELAATPPPRQAASTPVDSSAH